jgi:5'-nucleotidase / UDP-sugar diphosphatase
MGRETKILLAMLATLAGVFLGALSMKLLVPRPPVGAGPDVHIDGASAESHELVDPPSPSPPSPGPAAADSGFAAANPQAPARSVESPLNTDSGDLLPPPMPLDAPAAAPPANMPQAAARSDEQPMPLPASPAVPLRHDPFVAPAGLQMPITQPDGMPPSGMRPPVNEGPPPAAPLPVPSVAAYVANPGDSWWDLAERAYGDGRLYRALFAWNRVIDPRVSLTPGTRLEIPPRAKLEAAWPKLMPAE